MDLKDQMIEKTHKMNQFLLVLRNVRKVGGALLSAVRTCMKIKTNFVRKCQRFKFRDVSIFSSEITNLKPNGGLICGIEHQRR